MKMGTTTIARTSVDAESFVEHFGGIFEGDPWIAVACSKLKPLPPIDDIASVHAAMCTILREAPRGRQLALIRAHPDLLGEVAHHDRLTAASRREQTGAGLGQCTVEQASQLRRLNQLYKSKFGFPFVIAVEGRNGGQILEIFQRRLAGEHDDEFENALAEIERIARFRLERAQTERNGT